MANDNPSGVNFVIKLNGKYVKVSAGGKTKWQLQASEETSDKASRFSFQPQADGLTYAVQCIDADQPWSGNYVSRINNGGDQICASKLKVDTFCEFLIENTDAGIITLRCDNKNYWIADSNGFVTATDVYPDRKSHAETKAFFD